MSITSVYIPSEIICNIMYHHDLRFMISKELTQRIIEYLKTYNLLHLVLSFTPYEQYKCVTTLEKESFRDLYLETTSPLLIRTLNPRNNRNVRLTKLYKSLKNRSIVMDIDISDTLLVHLKILLKCGYDMDNRLTKHVQALIVKASTREDK